MPNPTTRELWTKLLTRIATPPLEALAHARMRADMPVESRPGQVGMRETYTHLEALGRTLAGIAPWLELASDPTNSDSPTRLRALACAAVTQAVTLGSPDHLNFTTGTQPLVDAAFLSHALLRAPNALWSGLDERTRSLLVVALKSTRTITPAFNNWLLFSAMIEAALLRFTGKADLMRIEYAVRQHEQWYKGDGAYGDGPDFHWDYYNSYVIQPMLVDIVEVAASVSKACESLAPAILARAQRYAAVQERLIAPDGTFPPLGRSLAYRCGAFQHLAQMALRKELPENISEAQVRGALTAVIRRTLEPAGTFDQAGWLQIGLAGHQPNIAEPYISTGSLYLCTTAFLPLGLPPDDPFWALPDQPWTSVKIWQGEDHAADHSMK